MPRLGREKFHRVTAGAFRGHLVIDAIRPTAQDGCVCTSPSPRHVVFVVFPGFQSLDLTGPFEVFAGANDLLDADGLPGPRYRLTIAAEHPGPVASESGLQTVAGTALADVTGAIDTLVVVGGRGVHRAASDSSLIDEVQRLAKGTRRIASVCTGTFILGHAGLLNNATVCTHWARADRFESTFPDATLDRDSIYRHDGRIWTSAGVTAGIDLALAMVADDHSPELAQVASRWLVMFYRRPGGQSQFAAPVWHGVSDRASIRAVQDAIVASPGADHRLPLLAAQAAMSERNFLRVFTREIGVTPTKFVESIRVDAACRALETTDATVDAIARTIGFGTAETMRRTFVRVKGVAPTDYRRRFTLQHA